MNSIGSCLQANNKKQQASTQQASNKQATRNKGKNIGKQQEATAGYRKIKQPETKSEQEVNQHMRNKKQQESKVNLSSKNTPNQPPKTISPSFDQINRGFPRAETTVLLIIVLVMAVGWGSYTYKISSPLVEDDR